MRCSCLSPATVHIGQRLSNELTIATMVDLLKHARAKKKFSLNTRVAIFLSSAADEEYFGLFDLHNYERLTLFAELW